VGCQRPEKTSECLRLTNCDRCSEAGELIGNDVGGSFSFLILLPNRVETVAVTNAVARIAAMTARLCGVSPFLITGPAPNAAVKMNAAS